MKKVCSMLIVFLMVVVYGSCSLATDFSIDDWMYQIAYDAGVNAAEEAGYTNYEIIVDENYNVTINVLETTPIMAPVEEHPEETQKSEAVAEKANVEVRLSTSEEYTLGMQELEKENIIEAMQHFLNALPNAEAEQKINENAADYVDELMFAEEYEIAQAFMLEHNFEGYEQLLAE